MRVPLEWLADYVDIEIPVDQLAEKLTMFGLKIEAVERAESGWKDIYIAQVVEIEPHPSSRKPLWIARVDDGSGDPVRVVTGAQNVKLHDKVPFVKIGGVLPHGPDGNPLRIQEREMAGIASQGMLASQFELGLSDEHSGIFILPADAPLGAPLATVLGGDVLVIETHPNRPDTLSIIGVAREAAAALQQQLTLPDLEDLQSAVEWIDAESIPVQVQAPELCPRYTALRIAGVGNAPSPWRIARRIQAAGMRSINLLVDLTNYVMLEYGQPVHAFDADLAGDEIVIRRARAEETLTTLDGITRTLNDSNLVIAGGQRIIGLAGVMGGENSEIGAGTTEIVLEAAMFDAVSVRGTAKQLGMRTEASIRFERGLAPEQTVLAQKRFLQLLAQYSSSKLRVSRLVDVSVGDPPTREVSMPMRHLHRLTGVSISGEDASDALSLLGFDVRSTGESIIAVVPFWRRVDIELPADLVEEVARSFGYQNVPATLPRHTSPPLPLPADIRWDEALGERLRACGVTETLTHSLTSPEAMARLSLDAAKARDSQDAWREMIPNPAGVYAHGALVRPVVLANPATTDRQIVRLMLLPSLLDSISRNLKHGDERLAFFEIGRTVFQRPENVDLPYERRTLAIALSGRRRPSDWQNSDPAPYTFFDMKGILSAIMDTLNILHWTVEPSAHPALHPGRSAIVRHGGHDVAFFGELHPLVAGAFDIQGWPVQVAEVDLDTLYAGARDRNQFHPLPRYPAAYRDLAIVVDAAVPAERVLSSVRSAAGDLLESSRIFDVYQGPAIGERRKSIAVGLTFRAPGATLTQEEVNGVVERIIDRLQQDVAATLRE